MKITGIIAEYNPFHNGHMYHLSQSRLESGSDYLVVVLSGDFVQRGEPAIADKYLRAKAALLGGADLVLELPTLYANGSAPNFAKGGVRLLNDLGCVDMLSFGAETDDLESLKKAVHIIASEPDDYKSILKEALKNGDNYPTARAKALKETIGDSDVLSTPNNILALEYLRALEECHSEIVPFAVRRLGEGYHSKAIGALSSATGIRSAFEEGKLPKDLSDTLPADTVRLLEEEWGVHAPVYAGDFDQMLLYELIRLAEQNRLPEASEALMKIHDCSEEIARRIVNSLKDFRSIPDFAQVLKTKNYSYTRIMRVLSHILLGITEETAKRSKAPDHVVPYARVLGFKKASAPLLKELDKNTKIPLLTKMADADRTLEAFYQENPETLSFARELLALDKKAADLYEAAASLKYKSSPRNEISRGIIIL